MGFILVLFCCLLGAFGCILKLANSTSVFAAAMLVEYTNKKYLHENEICFPKEHRFIVLLLRHGRYENTLTVVHNYVNLSDLNEWIDA